VLIHFAFCCFLQSAGGKYKVGSGQLDKFIYNK